MYLYFNIFANLLLYCMTEKKKHFEIPNLIIFYAYSYILFLESHAF